MQEQYNPQKIESKIQRYWEENKVFKVTEDESKEKYYCLSMFPYPSGRFKNCSRNTFATSSACCCEAKLTKSAVLAAALKIADGLDNL